MGKFATYLKRGSSHGFGTMAAPVFGDWSMNAAGSGNVNFARLISIPGPATKWGFRIRDGASGVWANGAPGSGTPLTASGQIVGHTVFGQIAWFDANNVQLSPWSDDLKSAVVT